MKKKDLKNKVLEELERTPIIQIACEKVGISRNTYYRWLNEDPFFAKDARDALGFGVGLVNDVAESNVLTGIKNKDTRHTHFWLTHRHPSYRKNYLNRHEIPFDKEEEERKIEKARKEIKEFQDKWFKKRE